MLVFPCSAYNIWGLGRAVRTWSFLLLWILVKVSSKCTPVPGWCWGMILWQLHWLKPVPILQAELFPTPHAGCAEAGWMLFLHGQCSAKSCVAKTGANNSCIAPVPPILCASPAALQYNPCWCQGWLADSSIIGQKKSKLSQWEERTNIEIWVTRYRLQRICLMYYLRRLTVAITHSPAGSKVLFQ